MPPVPSSTYQVRYPRELARQLLPMIAGPRVHEGAEDRPSGEGTPYGSIPIPPEDALARILDVTYMTSLCNEEGRECVFTVAYLSPARAAELGHGTFSFGSPLPFEPSYLRKLAPATDPALTCVAVWPAEGGALGIWGLIHHGDRT